MATTSYPGVGNLGLSDADWTTMYGSEDGIYNDFTADGNAFALQLDSATNRARIVAPVVPAGTTVPVIKVNGWSMEVTSDTDFTIPTTAGSYRIYAVYDPAANVADGAGNATTAGPVSLVKSDTVIIPNGRQVMLLYRIIRQTGEQLANAAVTDFRRWVGPHFTMTVMQSPRPSPTYELGHGPFARGTTMLDRINGMRQWQPNDNGELQFVNVAWTEATIALTLSSGMAQQDVQPRYAPPERNGRVQMQGTVKRANGNNIVNAASTTDVQIGSLSVFHAPSSLRRFPVYSDGKEIAFVKVTAEGNIFVYAGGKNVSWVDLSSISYQIG